MTHTDLKPCPFCGGKPEIVRKTAHFRKDRRIILVHCGTEDCLGRQPEWDDQGGYERERDTEAEAITAWNTRHPEYDVFRVRLGCVYEPTRTPDTAPRKPFCETCGKDVAEVLCPTCAKWWADNPPPAPSQSRDLIAEAQQCVADGTHEDAWDENGNPIGWVVEHHAISICKKLITALRAAEAEIAELTAFRNGYKDTIRRLQDSVSAAEAETARLREALEQIVENEDQFSMAWAAETARRALGGEP